MRFRDHPAITGNGDDNGKIDVFRANWRLLKPDPLNDLRDLTTPENREHIEGLKTSIQADGVKDILEIRFDGADIFVVDGKCRLTALHELRDEGWDKVATVLARQEPQGTDEAERTANMLRASSLRKNYDRLEFANGIRRLIRYGWSHERIAAFMGWKSVASVDGQLEVAALPIEVKAEVSAGTISATTARHIVKDHGPAAMDVLQDAKAKVKPNKEGAIKVKPRHVKPERAPAAAPAPAPEPDPLPSVREMIGSDYDLPLHPSATAAPATVSRATITSLIEATLPIFEAVRLTDLSMFEAGEMVGLQITIEQARAFDAAFSKVTGGES